MIILNFTARWYLPESLQAPRGISYLQPPITSTLASGLTAWLHVYELRPLVGYLHKEFEDEVKQKSIWMAHSIKQQIARSTTIKFAGRMFVESLESLATLLQASGPRAATFRPVYTITAPRSRNNHPCFANPRAYCYSRLHPERGHSWLPKPNAFQSSDRYSNSLHMILHHQAAGEGNFLDTRVRICPPRAQAHRRI